MNNREMNRYLRESGRIRLTVHDGQDRDDINDQLRRQWRGEREPIEEPAERRRPATSEEITAALRRLAEEG